LKTELNRGDTRAPDARYAIVVSLWNHEFTSRLADGAVEALTEAGAGEIATFNVPGAFELPVACQKAAQSGDFDAVIALGVVIRGDTPHFEYVAGQAAAGIMQASLLTGVPVMFGVITADNVEQVEKRCGDKADNKGYEAALSAVEMVNLFREMDASRERGKDKEKFFPHVV
jgi:6,7-dimethyl-8-ribityllumazine synthase